MEIAAPVITEAGRQANFTNEVGADGRIRYLHNVMGLWLLSETVRQYQRDGYRADLSELLTQAGEVRSTFDVFDTADPRFLAPGDMPGRIRDWYDERGLQVPMTRPEVVRAIVESLAAAFADGVRQAAELSGTPVRDRAHRRRRIPEQAAVPADRRPGRAAGTGRPGRGHRIGQCADQRPRPPPGRWRSRGAPSYRCHQVPTPAVHTPHPTHPHPAYGRDRKAHCSERGPVMKRRIPKVADLAPLMQFKKPELNARTRRLSAALTVEDLRAIAKRRTPGPRSTTPTAPRRPNCPWRGPDRRSRTSSSTRRSCGMCPRSTPVAPFWAVARSCRSVSRPPGSPG